MKSTKSADFVQVEPYGYRKMGSGDICAPFIRGMVVDGRETTEVTILFDDVKNMTGDKKQALKTAEKLHESHKGKALSIAIL